MADDRKADAELRLRQAFAEFQAAMEQATIEGVDVLSVMMSSGVELPPFLGSIATPAESPGADAAPGSFAPSSTSSSQG